MPVEGHIIDRVSGKSVVFKYFSDIGNPGGVAQYDSESVRGRSEEHLFYSYTSSDEYAFNFKLVASVDQSDDSDYDKIWNDHLFIKSFQYPDYGPGAQGAMYPPRRAIITVGTWFKKEGVIIHPTAHFMPPWDVRGYPGVIEISFNFKVIHAQPLGLESIRFGL